MALGHVRQFLIARCGSERYFKALQQCFIFLILVCLLRGTQAEASSLRELPHINYFGLSLEQALSIRVDQTNPPATSQIQGYEIDSILLFRILNKKGARSHPLHARSTFPNPIDGIKDGVELRVDGYLIAQVHSRSELALYLRALGISWNRAQIFYGESARALSEHGASYVINVLTEFSSAPTAEGQL